MDNDILKSIKEMLDKQSNDFESKLEKQRENINEDIKQQFKPINSRLKVLENDVKEIKFDIKSLKIASLELSSEHLNHIHKIDDAKTSKPIKDII